MGGKVNGAIAGPEGGNTRNVDGTDNLLGSAPPPSTGSIDAVRSVVVVAEEMVNPGDVVGTIGWD